jgi:hypothetical protein
LLDRCETLLLYFKKHFALSWLLSNFQNSNFYLFHEVGHFPTFQNISLSKFENIPNFYKYKTGQKKYKCVNKPFSQKRKMDAKFASTNSAISCLGLNWQNKLQIVPKKGLLVCTSSLQVIIVIYKLHLQVHLRVKLQVILSVLISVLLSNSNFNSKI